MISLTPPPSAFSSLFSTTALWIFWTRQLVGMNHRLSCVLQGVFHHPQPLPTRCQQQSLTPRLFQPKMSPVPKCPPWGGFGGQNQAQQTNTHLDDIAWCLSVCMSWKGKEVILSFCACHRYGWRKLGIGKVRDCFFNNIYSPYIGLERTATDTIILVKEF